jgi:hypothetical protein
MIATAGGSSRCLREPVPVGCSATSSLPNRILPLLIRSSVWRAPSESFAGRTRAFSSSTYCAADICRFPSPRPSERTQVKRSAIRRCCRPSDGPGPQLAIEGHLRGAASPQVPRAWSAQRWTTLLGMQTKHANSVQDRCTPVRRMPRHCNGRRLAPPNIQILTEVG